MSHEQTLQQLADLVGGSVVGDPQLVVRGLNGIDQAGSKIFQDTPDMRTIPPKMARKTRAVPKSC